jgi:DNA-binding FadR family transcriptional regulator
MWYKDIRYLISADQITDTADTAVHETSCILGETGVETLADSLRGPSLYQTVQQYLKDYIVSSHLKSGDPLPPEGQLAEQLKVSRGSVREAIRGLESLGIIDVRHGDGIYVRDFNLDSVLGLLSYGVAFDPCRLAEIVQIRKWLEIAAIGEVCKEITDSEIGELEEILARWEEDVAEGGTGSDQDREFHRALYSVLGNDSLIWLLDIFWRVYDMVRSGRRTRDPQDLPVSSAHRAVLQAVKSGDAQEARQAVRDHFRDIEAIIEQTISAPSAASS